MLMIEMIQWWYLRGWKIFLVRLKDRVKNTVDFFSISLLVRDLFAPFRQISAGETRVPSLSAKLSVFFDKLLSRLIGAIIRLFLLIIGTILIILECVMGVILTVLWPLAPFGVILCIVLSVMQVSF